MTDPILEVAGELEQDGKQIGQCARYAATLRTYWTPERAAFVKASEGFCAAWEGDYRNALQPAIVNSRLQDARTALFLAYRAMVEADKGKG